MTTTRARCLLAASPSLLFAILVAKLWLTGTLGYYVNDRTIWIVLIGGVVFAAVGLATLRSAWMSTHASGPSWRTAAYLIPIIVGLLVPAKPLSASTGQSSSLGALQLASHVSRGGAQDDFGGWIHALSGHPDIGWWSGRHATFVGFVAQQVGLPPSSFIVGRYLVTCCVVDATLLGFPIQLDRGRIPDQGAWIQVRGVFGTRFWVDPSGAHYPILEHARMSAVNIPSSPYLSP